MHYIWIFAPEKNVTFSMTFGNKIIFVFIDFFCSNWVLIYYLINFSTVGPDEDLGKISNCLTTVPNERSEHMWESAQLFFSKCILKKIFFGPLKFATFEVKSQFLSILLSKFNFKNSYLLGRVTIPLFCLYGVKIQRQDLIWVVSNVWNCDTP